jgi:hypothetical protein
MSYRLVILVLLLLIETQIALITSPYQKDKQEYPEVFYLIIICSCN